MLILFQLLFLDFPSGLFPSGYPAETLYALLFSSLHSITRPYLVSTVDTIFVNKHCVRSTRLRHSPNVAIRRQITNQYRSADGSSQVSSNGKRSCADVIHMLHECIRVGVWNYGPRPKADGNCKRGNGNSWHSFCRWRLVLLQLLYWMLKYPVTCHSGSFFPVMLTSPFLLGPLSLCSFMHFFVSSFILSFIPFPYFSPA